MDNMQRHKESIGAIEEAYNKSDKVTAETKRAIKDLFSTYIKGLTQEASKECCGLVDRFKSQGCDTNMLAVSYDGQLIDRTAKKKFRV